MRSLHVALLGGVRSLSDAISTPAVVGSVAWRMHMDFIGAATRQMRTKGGHFVRRRGALSPPCDECPSKYNFP